MTRPTYASQEALEDAWTRLLEGTLDDDHRAGGQGALGESPDVRRALLADRHVHGILRAMAWTRASEDTFVAEVAHRLAASRDDERFVAAVSRRVRVQALASSAGRRAAVEAPQRRWLALLLVPALAAGALALVLRSGGSRDADPTEPGVARGPALQPSASTGDEGSPGRTVPSATVAAVATVSRVEGAAFLVEGGQKVPTRASASVGQAQGLLTVGRESTARLMFHGGAEMELGPDALVASIAATPVRGAARAGSAEAAARSPFAEAVPTSSSLPARFEHRIFLAAGGLRATVPPQVGGAFWFATPHVEARADEARLALTVTGEGTRVQVESGRVHLRRSLGGESLVLTPGQQAIASLDRSPVATVSPPGGVALFFVGSVLLGAGDQAVKKRLESLGFEVRIRGAGSLLDTDAKYIALIVISSTIESPDLNTQFRELPVPILVWEAKLFDDLGMTGPMPAKDGPDSEGGLDRRARGDLVIKDPLHPIAAGLSGAVRVTNAAQTEMNWAQPGPLAHWIATLPGEPTKAGMFAYERGTPMIGLTAPARRVGLFLYNLTATDLTESGWTLFDAAVRWCAERRVDK